MLLTKQGVCDVRSALTTPDYAVVARTRLPAHVMPGMCILILVTIHEHEYLVSRCCALLYSEAKCAQL